MSRPIDSSRLFSFSFVVLERHFLLTLCGTRALLLTTRGSEEGEPHSAPCRDRSFFFLRVFLRLAEPRVLASSDTRFFGRSSTAELTHRLSSSAAFPGTLRFIRGFFFLFFLGCCRRMPGEQDAAPANNWISDFPKLISNFTLRSPQLVQNNSAQRTKISAYCCGTQTSALLLCFPSNLIIPLAHVSMSQG